MMGTAVNHYAAIDVSLELSSVCIVDATGKVVRESKVETRPEALVKFFRDFGLLLTRIGLEAGPLSQWLYAGLTDAGFETTLMETRHVKAALSARTVKTDRRDARGMAQLIRMGWFRPVHAKSPGSQEVRALLVARKQLQHKLRDIELSIRGILRGFGLKVGHVTDRSFERRIRELVTGHAMLEQIAEAMLAARATLLSQFNKLHKAVLDIVRHDDVCRRLMTTPGVGAIVAITYKSALDDPNRIEKSRNAGPLFGLTPKRYQSGETDVTGGISRVGDEMVRTALYEAANVLLSRVTRFSALKRWGLEVAKRRGLKRAKVAVARKLAVILHRMWIDGTTFQWSKTAAAQA
jgi:transposase